MMYILKPKALSMKIVAVETAMIFIFVGEKIEMDIEIPKEK
jgi:hypothetical protein